MANLSITEAWNETVAFVTREAHLLFPVSFLLIALPAGLAQLLAPVPARASPSSSTISPC